MIKDLPVGNVDANKVDFRNGFQNRAHFLEIVVGGTRADGDVLDDFWVVSREELPLFNARIYAEA